MSNSADDAMEFEEIISIGFSTKGLQAIKEFGIFQVYLNEVGGYESIRIPGVT